MTRALVTGANGHLGANLVRELIDRGWTVFAMVRLSSDLTSLKGLDITLRHGDILDPDSLDRAMQDIDIVFHAAAVYKNWTADPNEMIRPAVEGTENVLRAAKRAGVKRVIYTSSCNAVGFSSDVMSPPDETVWNDVLLLPYVRGKVLAERRAWEVAAELDLEVIAMLPTGVIGPHDHKITPTTAYLRDALAGKGPVLQGTTNVVDVRDVARAHVLAAERGTPGERYLIGGQNISDMHLVDLIAQTSGKRPMILAVPRFVLMGLAFAMEMAARFTGGEPGLTRDMVRTAHGRHVAFNTAKAHEHLGFTPRCPELVIRDAAAWLVQIGELAAPVRTPYAAGECCDGPAFEQWDARS